MTKEQFLDFCRGIDGAETDQPFNDDFKTWVCRHVDSRKWLVTVGKQLCVYFSAPYNVNLTTNRRGVFKKAFHRPERFGSLKFTYGTKQTE